MTHQQMAAIVRDYTAKTVTEALTPVLELNKALELRILELETRPAVVGPPGDKGDPGLAGAGVTSLLLSADARLIAHLTDGRTLDAGPVPRGTDGAPGAKGADGLQGPPGRAADPALVLDLKRDLDGLQAAVKSLPAPVPEMDPADIEATFSGLLRKELGVLETPRPRPTVKRIEKTPSGYLVTEV